MSCSSVSKIVLDPLAQGARHGIFRSLAPEVAPYVLVDMLEIACAASSSTVAIISGATRKGKHASVGESAAKGTLRVGFAQFELHRRGPRGGEVAAPAASQLQLRRTAVTI